MGSVGAHHIDPATSHERDELAVGCPGGVVDIQSGRAERPLGPSCRGHREDAPFLPSTALTTAIEAPPLLFFSNAICVPSGDHDGADAFFATSRSPVPSPFMT